MPIKGVSDFFSDVNGGMTIGQFLRINADETESVFIMSGTNPVHDQWATKV